MKRVEACKIDSDENGWILTVWSEDGDDHVFLLDFSTADELDKSLRDFRVHRAEGEEMKRLFQRGFGPNGETPGEWDVADRMLEMADMLNKARKENP